ncbi:TM0106 family RecB-like putative nuclease [Nocardiopsis sp. HNM0947]|uniref:TM0106 family RecB-like putative nuclease n=1 Tax=Nocardiopsis coralli TaxID=2772213 RepID=A0ABR9P6J9_9ACTN|nr:TM0106 family RecB-like putative nuclease [Nocardiopsis coralli]MBE2999467.1 TM0106 family RecB-like putative nuclease [Nocardiopsis coralli]
MFATTNGWVVSPTDLVDQLECDHRSHLKTALAAHLPGAPTPEPLDDLIAQHGLAHEHHTLHHLQALTHVEHMPDPGTDPHTLTQAARATTKAMEAGTPVLYQASFYHPLTPDGATTPLWFHGRADFLIRSDLDTTTGHLTHDPDFTYEPWDTKLTRRPTPAALVQLAAYAHALTHTGHHPHRMHLLTGDHHTHTLPTADFTPVLRPLTERLTHRLTQPPTLPTPTWGTPRPACDSCGYNTWCTQGRTAARHLSLVAGLRTDQAAKLTDAGLATIDHLATATPDQRPHTLPEATFDQLRAQAALQVEQDLTRTPTNPQGTVTAHVHAPDHLAALPAPSPGDLFFDMEGYPYHDEDDQRGLEYLFGATTEDQETETFHTFWAHDRTQEQRALEDFVDFATARIDADPGAHIYHYASYEADRLKHLSSAFATREEAVDRLLREHRLVDLYTVVRKSLRVSQRSYSIKALEPLYLPNTRAGQVTTATSSIDAYAAHLRAHTDGDHTGAQQILDDIAAYNRDDCHSTARLRDWLETLRDQHGVTERPLIQLELTEEEAERAHKRAQTQQRLAAITGPLNEHLPPTPDQRTPTDQARATLAALVGYYQREAQPPWREHFRRTQAPLSELETDTDCAVPHRVRAGEWIEPTGRQKKARRELRMDLDPARPHPFTTGQSVHLLTPTRPGQEPATTTATVTEAATDHLLITQTAEPDDTPRTRPVAVLPGAPVRAQPKDGALEQQATTTVKALPHWPHNAGTDILRAHPPRLCPPGPLPTTDDHDGDPIATVLAATDRLDHSYLAVQGPPGAGKTYLAAQLINHLIDQGRSVGVCSTGHKAVENVMHAALATAHNRGTTIHAAKRPKSRTEHTDHPWDEPTTPQAMATWRRRRQEQHEPHLIGGTAWAMTNAAMVADPLDVLIIDEAGQFALADTLAAATAAHNIVLLGDPRQLPQVVQGTHGEGADASALQHLMGTDTVIDPTRGYFLNTSRRMHPTVCSAISRLSYDNRLHAHPTTAQRTLTPLEPGVYAHPVTHTARTTHSPEEVDAVLAIAHTLLNQHLHPENTPLTGTDILVVAPYNLQVRALRRALNHASQHTPELAHIRVGTVDRFQGQEAAAVICSMTTSDAAQTNRGPSFVLDRNRLNVALSRAQRTAVVTYAPALRTTAPRTVDELRLLAAFTGLIDTARPWPT